MQKFYSGYGMYSDGKTLFVAKVSASFKGLNSEYHTYNLGEKKLQECLQDLFPYAKTEEQLEQDKARTGHSSSKKPLMERIVRFKDNIPDMLGVAVKDATVFYYAFATMSKPGPKLDIDAIISENPKAEFLSSPQLVHDWKYITIGDQSFVLICAVQKKLLIDTWTQYDSLSLRPLRFEPAPWAALRAAWSYHPPSQPKTFEIRILKGQEMSLAALNMGDVPIAWQLVPLDTNNLRATLFAIIQSFNTLARNLTSSETNPPIILQGSDMPEDLQEKINGMTNAPSIRVLKAPPYDGNLIAYGLGIGAMHPELSTMNLAKSVLKPMAMISTFPYLDSLISISAVALAVFSIWMHVGRIEHKINLQKALNEQTLWSKGMTNDQIAADTNGMKRGLGPMLEFYKDRVVWTEVLEELSALLSKNVKITSIECVDTLWDKKAMKAMKIIALVRSNGVPGKAENELEGLLVQLKESKKPQKIF